MDSAPLDSGRLAQVVSSLRRSLLAASRSINDLPEIPDSQIQLIRALPGNNALSPSELADELHLDRSTISNLLASMQRAGLVERIPDAKDKRRAQVKTSELARTLFATFDVASAELLGSALGRLDLHDQRTIASAVPALERLVDALSAPVSSLPNTE